MTQPLTPEREAEIRADELMEKCRSGGRASLADVEWLKNDVHDLAAEVDRLRTLLASREDDLRFLRDTAIPELRRAVQGHLDGKKRWRERAETAEARVAKLEPALAATGRSLSLFIFDSDDPGADALGAQWLYGQAMPTADDPFQQPRAFRSSVFSEAARAAEGLDEADAARSKDYRVGYTDGVLEVAEHLEKLADEAAAGTGVTS